MAPASGDKKGHKRRQGRAAQAKIHRPPRRKARTAKNTPLNAQRDATRKQELQRKRRENRPEQGRDNDSMPLSPGLEVVGLINRRTTAFLELPTRMARCHSPFELWSEQTRFVQGIFSDCQSVAQRMMTNTLDALPMTGSTRRVRFTP